MSAVNQLQSGLLSAFTANTPTSGPGADIIIELNKAQCKMQANENIFNEWHEITCHKAIMLQQHITGKIPATLPLVNYARVLR